MTKSTPSRRATKRGKSAGWHCPSASMKATQSDSVARAIDDRARVTFAHGIRNQLYRQYPCRLLEHRYGIVGRTILANDEADGNTTFDGHDVIELPQRLGDRGTLVVCRKDYIDHVLWTTHQFRS